jgi:hypothetical protein
MEPVTGLERHQWADGLLAVGLAAVADAVGEPRDLLELLGVVHEHGEMGFWDAFELQGSLYETGAADARAVFQIDRVPGRDGIWWVLVEPNGFRTSLDHVLRRLAGRGTAVSLFWNANSDMRVQRIVAGELVATFDPVLDVDQVPTEGRDLPFGVSAPRLAGLELLERWADVRFTREWLEAPRQTFSVDVPSNPDPPAVQAVRDPDLSGRFSRFSVAPGVHDARELRTEPRDASRMPGFAVARPDFSAQPGLRPLFGESSVWDVEFDDGRRLGVEADRCVVSETELIFEVLLAVDTNLPEPIASHCRQLTPHLAAYQRRFPLADVKGAFGRPAASNDCE